MAETSWPTATATTPIQAMDPGSGAQNPEGAKLITAAILHGAPPSTQILMEARVLPSTDPQFKNVVLPTDPAGKMAATIKGPPHLYVVDLNVDPRGIAFSDAADGGRDAPKSNSCWWGMTPRATA